MGIHISPLTIFDLGNLATFVPSLNKSYNINENENKDYTILVTTFNSANPLKIIDYLRKQKEHIIICDDGSTDKDFILYLNTLEKEGFRIIYNGHKKLIKWKFLKEVVTIPSREQALKEGLEYVNTKFCIFLDDDTIPEGNIGKAVNVIDEKKADLASLKCYPRNKERLIENLQNIEYHAAMLGREVRPYLTSGACLIGKTSSLRKIMEHHSLFYQGGDIEIGVLARKLKMKIIHINYAVNTEVPRTIRKWARQRAYWMSGGFRHAIINAHNYIKLDPLHVIYFSGIIWFLLFFKWKSNFVSPISLLWVLGIYIFITFISNLKIYKPLWKETKWYSWILFPIYAAFQVMILPLFGVFLYFKQVIKFKNWGVISIK